MKKQSTVAMLATVGLGLTLSVFTPLTATATMAPTPTSSELPPLVDDIGSLKEEAAKAGILIGSGSVKGMTTTADGRPPNYLSDPKYREVLAEQFDSLSPENDMKPLFLQPKEGVFEFEGLDRLVAFAEENDMQVKGHGLISACCNPDWLLAKSNDPAAFRAAVDKHITTVMKRYRGKMDRWDVVTEPLIPTGGGLADTDFYKALGPGYIAEAFRIADRANPKAKLYLNENLVESYPGKRQELYDLVSGLVADGVPIDGVALQMHQTIQGPPPGVITEMYNFFTALGLEVSISELDVHSLDPVTQAKIYGDVVTEALNAGITDISLWGFTDKHLYTWLPGAKPCIFDEYYNAKPAYFAVRDALRNFAEKTAPPTQPVGTLENTNDSVLH